jgi:site-specific recombinase XerC
MTAAIAMTTSGTSIPCGAGVQRFVPPGTRLEPVGLHLARHTFASYPAAAGLPVKDAQTFAGHSDVRTTLSIYTHTLDDAAALAAERVGAWLDDSARATVVRQRAHEPSGR